MNPRLMAWILFPGKAKSHMQIQPVSPFTLHIRLTKACNADCSYCSSWQANPEKFMNAEKVIESLKFIEKKWAMNGIKPTFISVEYVGGEILLVPPRELERVVLSVREFFSEKGIKVHDGAQSNLIGSKERVQNLNKLFEGRIGTSVDNTTEQRTISGSAEKYGVFFRQSENNLIASEQRNHVPAVFTIDKLSIRGIKKEIELAGRQKRNLTVRPIFEGGSSVNKLTTNEVTEAMLLAFDSWFMKLPIIVEPLYSLLKKRMMIHDRKSLTEAQDLCPFQSNCAFRSLSIEPNGDLYICQEMADANMGKIGNALKGDWNDDLFSMIASRPENLSSDCVSCPYLNVCQGGCMMQAVQSGRGYFGKSDYCETWKALFAAMDYRIHYSSSNALHNWLNYLENK